MGQKPSSLTQTHELTRTQVVRFFRIACAQVANTSVLPATAHIDLPQFTKLLTQEQPNDPSVPNDSKDNPLLTATKLLYDGCIRLGDYPFVNPNPEITTLATDALLCCIVLFTKPAALVDINYTKMCFMLLAERKDGKTDADKTLLDEKTFNEYATFPVQIHGDIDINDPELVARNIDWRKSPNDANFDTSTHRLCAASLLQVITLFLILNHLDLDVLTEVGRWEMYEHMAFNLMKNLNVNLKRKSVDRYYFTYEEYEEFTRYLPSFGENFKMLFARFGGMRLVKGTKNDDNSTDEIVCANPTPSVKRTQKTQFVPSKLVDGPSISMMSLMLEGLNRPSVSTSRLIKLYSGLESGFLLRSLELKIFKWNAPTVFVVSGKRLKRRTVDTNKRYELFEALYPRFFKNYILRDWQGESDTVTYMVYVNVPWRVSNKTNFGDSSTLIMAMEPRVDYFLGTKGELVYFNNVGMGLGFGNDQPIVKNTLKKLLPGNVSLTVESNLEFCVFRQVTSAGSGSVLSMFSPSRSLHEDYEDRFMITDLEVWGVGSDEELQEQLKEWAWEQKQAEARRTVNLKNMGEERAFLEMVGLVGNHGGGSM